MIRERIKENDERKSDIFDTLNWLLYLLLFIVSCSNNNAIFNMCLSAEDKENKGVLIQFPNFTGIMLIRRSLPFLSESFRMK